MDSNILKRFADAVQREMGEAAVAEKDFRKILEQRNVDAITIATPDHWHTPMAIAGLQAGKHVYVEKPCSHNPAEGEMLIEVQQKYRKLVQMGNQQRSSPHTIKIVEKIHQGIIGMPYFAKAWYSNVKGSRSAQAKKFPCRRTLIGICGRARRRARRIEIMFIPTTGTGSEPYGTGETLNNGTHEVDVCRWALGVDYPKRVTSSGGRYQFKDDWQFYDTLVTSFEYEDKMISWEGKSCQGMKYYGRDRGSTIMGTAGTVLVDRDGYEIYDLKGNKTSEFKAGSASTSSDLDWPRFHDRRSLRELHRGNPQRREAERPGLGRATSR